MLRRAVGARGWPWLGDRTGDVDVPGALPYPLVADERRDEADRRSGFDRRVGPRPFLGPDRRRALRRSLVDRRAARHLLRAVTIAEIRAVAERRRSGRL
ncbi:hypothetical protein [Conexibacter sp. SYSU D00693]|uniref:hypothetical protein n=1 Tax=Conexibacter sp. SYSU D00693 TaxID=2812560 RepID=UPI00196B3245|nr:hypothetical protein [Conexibacter sp. SYSU D00693]